MKKPEQKKLNNIYSESYSDGEISGYNQACDEWEKYHNQEIKGISSWYKEWADNLPNEDEIWEILDNTTDYNVTLRDYAKAIYKRINDKRTDIKESD